MGIRCLKAPARRVRLVVRATLVAVLLSLVAYIVITDRLGPARGKPQIPGITIFVSVLLALTVLCWVGVQVVTLLVARRRDK